MSQTKTTEFISKLATEKVVLEQILGAYRYMNIYGLTLEKAIQYETDRLLTMKKLSAVNTAIDCWTKTLEETNV